MAPLGQRGVEQLGRAINAKGSEVPEFLRDMLYQLLEEIGSSRRARSVSSVSWLRSRGGDSFKRVDIPPDELGERGRIVLGACERGRILQDNLAVSCPRNCRYAMRESLIFLVDDGLAFSNANDRCVSRGSIGLLACADRCHAEFLEESSYS